MSEQLRSEEVEELDFKNEMIKWSSVKRTIMTDSCSSYKAKDRKEQQPGLGFCRFLSGNTGDVTELVVALFDPVQLP